ncbi:glycerol-3-phosphate dehydrogenase/oxidase [Nocardia puris]|uniref:glycerol-3-phosphate dehydrogenase n=1 Tax=Nocardia puris TaxID=208602 RepID=A0A366DWH9_9NOCA|nr:glycerol-3-phosphate dehydrogenase/oxidase [Nocardia puris]MBF6210228.1 glycerol-3-phosphate dehydrogenase/oxidase [Nocardia puris]MBF6367304.1 glycerol-3-phosphate dehydrogenase/oxidase [Nocardia puris]MBF6457489.1 glycerol-3-phosphate dehydrogenase/oxidase [Nocardia puris]RBO93644.1 glycerol-3-phosphate dehydrogenase [Nocardia puris]
MADRSLTAPVAMSPARRARALDTMANTELDVLVVGAGVVGAGAALDAVTRGLTVGLVEARDYASGTSSRSSKLIHGGLRYLKQLNFALVFEALRERSLILDTLAPHLAKPVEFVYPLEKPGLDRAWVGAGVGVYDVLGAGRGVPAHHRHLGKRKTLARFPGAKRGGVHGGVSFYEGQLDDARHTMMLARTAASHGAHVASSARVVDFLRSGDQVVGAVVRDLETGRRIDVRAKRVINAAGPWTDEIQEMLGGDREFGIRTSKGVHIVVPRDRIDSEVGLITETEKSLLFVIPCPWSDDHWVIGTTDTDWDHDLAHPAATRADIDYILAQVNRLLEQPIGHEDIVGVYAGLRPLLAAGDVAQTSALSREHTVVNPVPGLVIVAGGKYTTYRVMAADAVDLAVRDLPGRVGASRTAKVPLVGAHGYRELSLSRSRLAAEFGVDARTVDHLLGRYGSAVAELRDLIFADPELAAPLGNSRYLRAEIVYAVTHEGALHLDDILTRRTRLSVETVDRGVLLAGEVAKLVAPHLGWDESAVAREIENYRARVEAEIRSNEQVDDMAADAVRLAAPDSRGAAPESDAVSVS